MPDKVNDSSYKYSNLSPEDRKKWLKRRSGQVDGYEKQIFLNKDGTIRYESNQGGKAKGLQDLFNVPKDQIKEIKNKDGSYTYTVFDSIEKFEDIERNTLNPLIESHKKNRSSTYRPSSSRSEWFEKHNKKISVTKDGFVVYKTKDSGDKNKSLSLLFNTDANNIEKSEDKDGEYFIYKVKDQVSNFEPIEKKFLAEQIKNPIEFKSQREQWFEKNKENVSIDDNGFVVYKSKKANIEKGIGKLFNVDTSNVKPQIQKDGDNFVYKVKDHVDNFEPIEKKMLTDKIEDYQDRKNRIKYLDQRAKNKQIYIKDGYPYYITDTPTSATRKTEINKGLQLLFNVEADKIKSIKTADGKTHYKIDNHVSKFEDVEIKALRQIVDKPVSSDEGIDYLKSREAGALNSKGRYPVEYLECDKAHGDAVLTTGFGHTNLKNGGGKYIHIDVTLKDGRHINQKVYDGDSISPEIAELLLKEDVKENEEKLYEYLPFAELSKGQTDALLSYMHNADSNKFINNKNKTPFFQLINEGKLDEAQGRFNIITAGGPPIPGLVSRRIEEIAIFGGGKISEEGYANIKEMKKKLLNKGATGQNKLTSAHYNTIRQNLKDYGLSDNQIEAYITKIKKL